MGCDAQRILDAGLAMEFQSTHPVWDATSQAASPTPSPTDFNPRIPYGMRHKLDLKDAGGTIFQSTHPVWDATARMDIAFHNMEIFARSSS